MMADKPSRWLPVLVGWVLGTTVLESLPRGTERMPPAPRACALAVDDGLAGPWVPAPFCGELRRLPGIGRKRARLLEARIRADGVDLRLPQAEEWLLGLPGIGPVSAGAVLGWVRERYPLVQDEAVHFEAASWPIPNP